MIEKEIKTELIPGVIIDDESLQAAIIIPIVNIDGLDQLLFEVRASNLPDQPGDICFPGGIIEQGESPKDAAIRETCEELLIEKDQIEMLGPTLVLCTSSLVMYPYVAKLKDYKGTFSKEETAEVFTVPIDFFINTEPEKYRIDWSVNLPDNFPYERINGGKNYKWRKHKQTEIFYEYSGRTIWGLTARVIYNAFVKHALGAYQLVK